MDKTQAKDLLELESQYEAGFHGIIQLPDGREGFLSKIESEGSEMISWYIIGKGQDPVEVMKLAKLLHNAQSAPVERKIDPDYLRYLGERLEELEKPRID